MFLYPVLLLMFNRQWQISGTSSKTICSHLVPSLLPAVSKQDWKNTKNMLTRADCPHSLQTKNKEGKNLSSHLTNPLPPNPPTLPQVHLEHLLLVKRIQPWTERGWWYPLMKMNIQLLYKGSWKAAQPALAVPVKLAARWGWREGSKSLGWSGEVGCEGGSVEMTRLADKQGRHGACVLLWKMSRKQFINSFCIHIDVDSVTLVRQQTVNLLGKQTSTVYFRYMLPVLSHTHRPPKEGALVNNFDY